MQVRDGGRRDLPVLDLPDDDLASQYGREEPKPACVWRICVFHLVGWEGSLFEREGGNSLNLQPAAIWEVPDSDEKIVDLERDEFRIRFAAQTWTGRIGAPEVLSEQKLSSLLSSTPAAGADYCIWLPGAASAANHLLANDPGEPVLYSVTAHDRDGQSSTSIVFDMRTPADLHLGTLQCVFPRTSSAASIAFGRWTSIVGAYLRLEVRP